MKQMPLSQGKFALVDDDDFEFLSQWKWSYRKDGYAVRRGGKTVFRMHREIMRAPTGMLIDHINGDKLDNTRSNLRFATKSENAMNSKKRSGVSSRFKGVHWDKTRSKFFAQVKAGKTHISIGRFSSEVDAALAYNFVADRLHGEFGHLNKSG